MAQILPQRGWLVTFAIPSTWGSNPLDWAGHHWASLNLFTNEHPEITAGDLAAPLPEVVARPDLDPEMLRAIGGVASVVPAWYVTSNDEAYHPDLTGRFLNDHPAGPFVCLWTDRTAAVAALAERHGPTRCLVEFRDHDADALVRSLAGAVLDGEDALGPLADLLTDACCYQADYVRRLYLTHGDTLRAAAWSPGDAGGGELLALFPDGRLAISAAGDRTLVWEVGTGSIVHVWERRNQVAAVAPPGGRLALGDGMRLTVSYWPPDHEYSQACPARALAFSPDGRILAGLTEPGFWVQEFFQAYRRIPFALAGATALAFSPDGQHLIVPHGSGVSWWRTDTWERAGAFSGYGVVAHRSAAFSSGTPPSTLGVCCCADDTVRLWLLILGVEEVRRTVPGAALVRFAPAGDLLAIACATGDVWLLRLAVLDHWASWRAHASGVRFLAFQPDGTRLLTQGDDGPPVVWNLAPLLEA